MLTKKEVLSYTKRLDRLANDIQSNWQNYGMDKKAAFNFCYQVDSLSDRLERMVGIDKRSDVLERDDDEPYVDEYDESGALEHDADEPYMTEEYDGDRFDQFGDPEEGESSAELQNKRDAQESWDIPSDEEVTTEASGGDYWDNSRTASGDYWDDNSSDYW